MPRGFKRICLAAALFSFAAMLLLGIIVSRWRVIKLQYWGDRVELRIALSAGSLLIEIHDFTPALLADPAIDTTWWTFETSPRTPRGPDFLNPDRRYRPQPPNIRSKRIVSISDLWRLGYLWHEPRRTVGIFIIAWPIPLMLLIPAVLLIRPALRALGRKPGHCHVCNYDLTQLEPSAPCPECGQVPPSPRCSERGEVPEGR